MSNKSSKNELKSWKFNFGSKKIINKDYINVTADMKYRKDRGYGFLGLGKYAYQEDFRSDGFRMIEGQEIIFRETSKLNNVPKNGAIAVQEADMPIRFALLVDPNTYYKVNITLTGADQTKDAEIDLFSEKRHFHLTKKHIPAGKNLIYEFNVNVQNVFSKNTGVYLDTMLNIVLGGKNAAISSLEVKQLVEGKTFWVLGDSTVCDQLADLPYFRLQNYAGVGQALSKYLGKEIALSNHGESGLETNSSKPHFNTFKENIQAGDIVFFEFGHNHKEENGPINYYNNIPYYYDFAHQRGAKFVVVGPIDRHNPSQYDPKTNTWSSTLASFSEKGKQFVEEQLAAGRTDIAFVDLNLSSLNWYSKLCEELGRKASSTDYYFRGAPGDGVDGTHPNDAGVDFFAKIFFDNAKAIVEENPDSPQAKVLSYMMEGLRDEKPCKVPATITSLGEAPNSAYPQAYSAKLSPEFPLVIKDVGIDDSGKILSMTVKKQADFTTYGCGIVEIYREDGSLKGVAYANEQIDNTLEGTQTVLFSTDLSLGSEEGLKAYVRGYKDDPDNDNPWTEQYAKVLLL